MPHVVVILSHLQLLAPPPSPRAPASSRLSPRRSGGLVKLVTLVRRKPHWTCWRRSAGWSNMRRRSPPPPSLPCPPTRPGRRRSGRTSLVTTLFMRRRRHRSHRDSRSTTPMENPPLPPPPRRKEAQVEAQAGAQVAAAQRSPGGFTMHDTDGEPAAAAAYYGDQGESLAPLIPNQAPGTSTDQRKQKTKVENHQGIDPVTFGSRDYLSGAGMSKLGYEKAEHRHVACV